MTNDTTQAPKAFYFGCKDGPGHHLWTHNGCSSCPDGIPWGYDIDSGLCPKDTGQKQGYATVNHKDGWTAVAFWDRSVDKRFGSNSAFIVEGTLGFDEVMRVARERFPWVMDRFSFQVRPMAEVAHVK